METRICKVCATEKPIEQFARNRTGRLWRCNPCNAANQRQVRAANLPRWKTYRRNTRLKRHGITQVEYDRKLAAQGGRCALCLRPDNLPYAHFAIDHDHRTGAFRGLLCTQCNRALGLFYEDAAQLRAAADYIDRP